MQLRHSLLYLLAHSIPALAAFLTLALYTRWISPEVYGIYSTLVVVANSANIILFNWLYVALMRYWNTDEFQEDEFNNLVLLVLAVGSVFILTAAAIYFMFSHEGLVAFALAGLMISNAIYTAYQRINSISLQAERYLMIEISRVVLTTLLAVTLVWFGYSWYGILFATSIGFISIPVISTHFWQRFGYFPSAINYNQLLKLIKYGLPLSLTFMLLELIHATDRVLLSWIVGFDVAGQYAVAFSLPFQLLILIGSAINMAAYPLILQALERQGEEVAKRKLADYLLVLLGLLLPSYFGLIAVSEDFMPLLIGQDYLADSLRLLPVIGLLLVINAIYLFHTSLAFQIAKQTSLAIRVAAVAAVLNVMLNLILIPYYQIEGALFASLISYLLCVIYGYRLGASYFKMPILWKEVFKLVFSAIFMLLVLKFLPIGHGLVDGLIRIFVGLIVYSTTIWLFNIGDVRVVLVNFLKNVNKYNETIDYQT